MYYKVTGIKGNFMTITTQRLLTELGNRSSSGFNKDDMVFGGEDAVTALAELNAAHRYLMSLEDFPFKNRIEELETMVGVRDYSMFPGQICEILNADTLFPLEEVPVLQPNTTAGGVPKFYCINYSNPDSYINLMPTPERVYKFSVVYDSVKFIIDKRGNELDEFENADDILNMPSYLEFLYMDCLVLRTIATNCKDSEDENYIPTINEFKEAWRNFVKKAKPVKKGQRVVI